MDDPIFPALLYIYDKGGMRGEGIQINTEAQLNGLGTRFILSGAMKQGVEIRLTDPMDRLLFHANHGRVIFPPQH